MRPNPFPIPGHAPSRGGRGYALIMVLMIMALITVMIVSLFVLSRDDRTRARSYMEVGRSRFLVDMASQEILAKLMDGSKIPYEGGKAIASYTAAPGVIEMRKYKEPINKGYHKGGAGWDDPKAWARNPFAHDYEHKSSGDWQPANPLTIPLYSRRWFAPAIRYMTTFQGNVSDGNPDYNPARVFNINTPRNPFAPGSLYISGSPDKSMVVKDFEAELGNWQDKSDLLKRDEADGYRFQPGEAASDRPLNVQWMPIYKIAGKGPVYTDAKGRNRRNPIVGRYAYWVDVENTKVNVNVSDRKFVDSELSTILGETEALNPSSGTNAFYFVQNPNVNEPGISDAVTIRGELEGTQMNATGAPYVFPEPPTTIINKGKEGRGDNAAAAHYHRMWMDWRPDGTPPYLADNSLVDWRAFTGLRPYSDGLGENTTIEGLLADASIDNNNRFNTFSEVFSLLDPKTEEEDPERGLAALTAMRRTYGNAATIYGWDDERDPLGLPKIDIVKLQLGGVDGPGFTEMLKRLKDPDYYLAYHTGAEPGNKSFARGLNGLVGDNDPNNDANGDAAARQMLTNIVEYGKPHSAAPYMNEATGIVGAKSMPYVTEVATRARNGFWRLYEPVKNADGNDEDAAFDTMANDFATKVEELTQAKESGDPIQIELKLRAVTGFNDPAGTFSSRAGGKSVEDFVRNVTVDLNAGMANPNPFAEKTTDSRNAYFNGSLKLNYTWSGVTPIELPAEGGTTQNFEGLYVARPIAMSIWWERTPRGGVRADGESVYFDLGMIPGETMSDPTKTTALRIEGWEVRKGGALFHKVPIRHLGQGSTPRPWWAMAQPDANPGQVSNNGHSGFKGTFRGNPDYYSLASFYQPYNIEFHNTSGQSYQWEIPNVPINPVTQKPNPVTSAFPYEEWKNVSVGWFTARTIAEHCRTYGEDVVQQGLPGCLYVSEVGWEALTTEWETARSGDAAQLTEFLKPDGKFTRAVNTLKHIADSVDKKTPAMVETVVACDPTVGHRTGNPDAYRHADLGRDLNDLPLPTGLPEENVGHFYGTNGHPWRLAALPPGPPLGTDEPVPPSGTPRRVPVYEPIYGEKVITYKTPVGNTYITTTKTILVKVGERVVGHRTVYPNKGGGGGSRGPIRQNYTLTENFSTPKLTSVAQGDLFGDVIAHAELELGWHAEGVVGGGKYASPRVKGPLGQRSFLGFDSFFSSAPKGDLMVSVGEIGFCHSGLLGRPIQLTKTHTNHPTHSPPYWWDTDVPYVGSPKHGLAPSTLLDLLTPGAFRDNATGKRYTEAEWRGGAGSNTPDNPRRGTWNINAVPASDTYMAMREGTGDRHNQNVDHQSRSLSQLKTHPAWAPNGHGMRKSWGDDRGWLDPMMNPYPRYRRGLESWLSIMVGDYTPFRSRGEAIWGRVEVGGAYAVLSAPWFSWRAGIGATGDPSDPTVPFDPEYNSSASALLAMGRISIDATDPNNSRKFTKHGATGLFYIDQGYDTSASFHDPRFPLSDTARAGNFPLRHHNSELISVSAQDITELHTALNPKNSSVGWTITGGGYHRRSDVTYGFLGKYGTYFQPYQGFAASKTHNGHPGSYVGTGIYANAPVVLSANQVSTSANVFTAHIVTQAIRDNGSEREDFSTPAENTNTGLGYMDLDDEVLGEQWSQVVIARIPGSGTDPDTGGPRYDFKILYSRTLDHQVN